MRSETYSRFVQAQPLPQATSASAPAQADHVHDRGQRLLRRLDPALAFLVVSAAAWTSWGIGQWLLTRWEFH